MIWAEWPLNSVGQAQLSLFAGSDSGGGRAASIYTLVASALLNGLNPEAYLKDILTKIAEGHTINRIDELMPWRMASAAESQPP